MKALISKKKLKPFLNLDEDDDRYDAVIEALVLSVTASIEHYLDRSLERQEVSEYFSSSEIFDDKDISLIWLKNYPVVDSLFYNNTIGDVFTVGGQIELAHQEILSINVFKDTEELIAYVDDVTPYDYKIDNKLGILEFSNTPATVGLIDNDPIVWDYIYDFSYKIDYDKCFNHLNEKNINDYTFIEKNFGLIRVFPNIPGIKDDLYNYKNNPVGFKITYAGGYEVIDANWEYLDVPIGISTATALQVSFLFDSHQRGSTGLTVSSSDLPDSPKNQIFTSNDVPPLIPEAIMLLRPFIRRGTLIGRVD